MSASTSETALEVKSTARKPLTTLKPPKKLKPARKQVKPGEVEKKETPQTGKEYNIWYNKWAGGDREDQYSNKTKSQTRCNIKKDQGMTRANQTGIRYCCLFFARGCCPYGWECEYLHMLPDASWALPDSAKDCFARDKFVDYRDDMGGVGSFSRQNRTLYVGRVKETGPGPETEEIVIRHFKEWGEIEKIRILQYRSVAFVTYVSELSAQFAKEAMACQSLDNDEILNVRWATEDPNPTAKVEETERLEEVGKKAIQERMDPKLIDAMRAVRALEDGDILNDDGELSRENGYEDEDEAWDDTDGPPSAKRQRVEAKAPATPEPPKPAGILSADTMEGLNYFAQIRKRYESNKPVIVKQTATPPAKPLSVGIGLADYGSDDDDE